MRNQAQMVALSLLMMSSTQCINLKQQLRIKNKANTESNLEAQLELEESYKSDALDELLEGSLFKKKAQNQELSADQMVNAALFAKVDPKTFNIEADGSTVAAQAPAVVAPPPDATQVQVPDQDTSLIQTHLATQLGKTAPVMGSNILYSALNDLDLGDAKIPAFTPPGMPPQGPANNQLYGTALAPASPWASNLVQTDMTTVQDSLNDQTATQLSAESYLRGGDKYQEQASALIENDEEEVKNNVLIQTALAQVAQQKQQEDADMGELIETAFQGMKTNAKKPQDIQKQIETNQALAYVVAFGQ